MYVYTLVTDTLSLYPGTIKLQVEYPTLPENIAMKQAKGASYFDTVKHKDRCECYHYSNE